MPISFPDLVSWWCHWVWEDGSGLKVGIARFHVSWDIHRRGDRMAQMNSPGRPQPRRVWGKSELLAPADSSVSSAMWGSPLWPSLTPSLQWSVSQTSLTHLQSHCPGHTSPAGLLFRLNHLIDPPCSTLSPFNWTSVRIVLEGMLQSSL